MHEKTVLSLTGANQNNNRRELDYYPTPANVTISLLNFLKLPKDFIIWEPATGEGYMSRVIKNYGYQVIETDIITGDDFLNTNKHCDAIITNPPFALADKFIEKAVKNTYLVAFLLKSQYWHAAKRIDLFKSYSPSYVLPLTWRPDFYEHEREAGKKGSSTMDVVWNVWIKGKNITQYLPLSKPQDLDGL